MRFNTFEEYCDHHGIAEADVLPDVAVVPEKHQAAILSTTKLILLTEAINEGHEFNWNDRKERKWRPWFDLEVDNNNPTGFRFVVSCCDGVDTDAGGGSRLCYRTESDSDFAGTAWEKYWRDLMVIQK